MTIQYQVEGWPVEVVTRGKETFRAYVRDGLAVDVAYVGVMARDAVEAGIILRQEAMRRVADAAKATAAARKERKRA